MLKVKNTTTWEELEANGFCVIYNEDDYTINQERCYILGHSRRGQFYYYVINNDRTISIYASDADGSGGKILLDDIIIKMYNDGLLEII